MRQTYPLLTVTLIGVFCLVFVGQQFFAILPNPSFLSSHIATLITLGGLNKSIIELSGQGYRVLTAGFLHGSLVHLIFNSYATLIAASFLERYMGKSWLLFIFFVSMVASSALSLYINPAILTSVGASGGLMGLFGALLIMAWLWLPPGDLRRQIFGISIQVAIFGLLPILSLFGQNIDYAGHFGGFIAGVVITLILHFISPRLSPNRLLPLIKLINIGFITILLYGWWDLASSYSEFKETFLKQFNSTFVKK